ncbi:MAG: polysaccharide deacetylase family protein [Clostridia bacterium]|nr:polysaccharide deacetylase family protein [Clostridia bacterium]MBR2874994.1 polysaccharide deacetylase family protein [Clostridia bacterium]
MNKKKLIILTVALSLCIVLISSIIISPHAPTSALYKKTPIYRVDRADKVIALSFDAAWGRDETLKILSVLDKYNVKATFFLVAFWAEKYPDLVKTIVSSGHEIGTHSSTHPHFNSLSMDKKRAELQSSVQRITAIANYKITNFRPPFGEYDDSLLTLCKELKLNAVQWDVDSLDWKGLSASEITQRVMSKVKSGSIILCHNDGEHTAQAIEEFIPKLINEGYHITTVENTLIKGEYYTDSNGEQKAVN